MKDTVMGPYRSKDVLIMTPDSFLAPPAQKWLLFWQSVNGPLRIMGYEKKKEADHAKRSLLAEAREVTITKAVRK